MNIVKNKKYIYGYNIVIINLAIFLLLTAILIILGKDITPTLSIFIIMFAQIFFLLVYTIYNFVNKDYKTGKYLLLSLVLILLIGIPACIFLSKIT